MMTMIWLFLYNCVIVPLMVAGFYAGSLFNAKMREGSIARRKQFSFLRAEINKLKRSKRIYFHCTSAGEWLQAVPIIEKLRQNDSDMNILVSFFSPSGYRFAGNHTGVDLKFYMPLDTRCAARKLFRILQPDLWIISKFDIWPNHVLAASALKVPVVITSATLSADSRRDKGIVKHFNKFIYSKISHFFPISKDDKSRFCCLAPGDEKYTIAGDTRYDHVYNRGRKADDAGDVKIFRDKRAVTIIAGSTWPADEKHILPALTAILEENEDLNLIVVPHELHEGHLSDIEKVFKAKDIRTERYTDFSDTGVATAHVVIFNTVGLLARLYKQTDMAFIGGSFGKGTHNVMEPAIFGQPVLFGPNHLNSYEAGELLKAGAAFKVTNAEEFHEKVSLLIRNTVLRKSMGEKAKNLIVQNIGATDIIINKLKEKYGIIS
jgi:3-deoxy-D-manno-octulosonic-acid transferase